MTRFGRASGLVAACGLGLACASPAMATNNLTPAEKRLVRDMMNIYWQLMWEDCRDATFQSELNPNSQSGPQTDYEQKKLRSGAMRDPNLRDGLWTYLDMMRNNRLCKDDRAGGGQTNLVDGIGTDTVIISGPQLTSATGNANSVLRARDKFFVAATLVNELVHVYQEAETGTATQRDRKRCDAERDSDTLTVKFLCALIDRLESSAGTPHTSLAGIRGEGGAGDRIADCLSAAGVNTQAEINQFYQWMKFRKRLYEERRDALFTTQIDQNKSWRSLYYGGRWKNPLLLRRDITNTATTRMFKLTWIDGTMQTYTIPNDGKRPARIIIDTDSNSCIYVRIITQGADGSRCIYTWTDTNKDGLPDVGSPPASQSFPAPGGAPKDVGMEDLYAVRGVPDCLGFQNGFLVHDQVNGRLVAYETDANDLFLTGTEVEIINDPLLVDPIFDGTGGGFSHFVIDFPDQLTGQCVFVYSDVPTAGQFRDANAIQLLFDPNTQQAQLFGPMPLAQAVFPESSVAVSDLFLAPVFHGAPDDFVEMLSFGQGVPNPLADAPLDPTGTSQPLPLPPYPENDLLLLQALGIGQQALLGVHRVAEHADLLEVDYQSDGTPEVLMLGTLPGRLVMFEGIPAQPAPQYLYELALIGCEPGQFLPPVPLPPPPNLPIPIPYPNFESQLFPIPQGPFPPLFFEQPLNLDQTGGDNDAAIVVRQPGQPNFDVLTFVQLDLPLGFFNPLQQIPLPPTLEPGKILFPDFNNDGLPDLLIEDFSGDPLLSQCFISLGDGTLQPGPCPQPCPADLTGSSDPNDSSYGQPDGDADGDDFFFYLDAFANGNLAVCDLTGSSDPNDPSFGVPDGDCDGDDFFFYLDLFAAGCP